MPDRHEGKSRWRDGGEHEAPIITGRHESELLEAIDRLGHPAAAGAIRDHPRNLWRKVAM
jgi:hypothetical protein